MQARETAVTIDRRSFLQSAAIVSGATALFGWPAWAEVKQRCVGLGITGVSLHSYRNAWAERARTCGYPARFAQEALGHNSKAVHRAYAKRAEVKIPSLDDYEQKARKSNIVPFPAGARAKVRPAKVTQT